MNNETASVFVREQAARQLIKNFPDSEAGKKAASSIDALTKAVAYEKSGAQWTYDSTAEGMSDKQIRTARVRSKNTISLGFPYEGAQHATLTFRRHPRWGNDVVLSIEKGQILCHSYGDCSIGVRFDDGKLLRYEGNPPADNSSEVVFIPAFSKFMKELPKSERVRIEIQLYQAGNPVFEFDVSGFKPEKFK